MCLEHRESRGISRRGLGTMLAGAAGLSLMPFAARAGNVDTLCVTCIDYRFVQKDVTWLNTHLNLDFDNWDVVALAGASLAAIQTRVPQKPEAFTDQIAIAQALHHIKKVILLDHMDCGAYRVAYGSPPPPPFDRPVLSPADEEHWHKLVMPHVAQILRSAPYGLNVECYLMPLQGPPQLIPG